MQSTCRKMRKIPDTVWMTMIQQYNKNSGKDGKQQGMQVRNEFQSQACPWPLTHSDWVHVGRGLPITCWIVGGNAAKCWHWTAFPFRYNKCWKHWSCVKIYFIFSLCVNPSGKLGYFCPDNLCREKLGSELKHLCHCVCTCADLFSSIQYVYLYSFSLYTSTTKKIFTMIAPNETTLNF